MDIEVLIERQHYWGILSMYLGWYKSEYFGIYFDRVRVFKKIK